MLIITISLSRLANRVKVAGTLQHTMSANLGPNRLEFYLASKRIDARDSHAHVIAQTKLFAMAAVFYLPVTYRSSRSN